ncbi:MAG: hypothetical protein CL489_17840 [Acidobacteria bacterium]|nr:hypothetical protein [Acidobacteriota bacterium]|tara:strand:- start:4463 stop:6046 length:1584 start_codon:yes stop_codon:yes gene_type:complete
MAGRKPKFVHVALFDVDGLTKATYNPRKTDSHRYSLVKISLQKLGWVLPMYITDDGEILSGHQRLDAARELGAKKVPCVVLPDLDLDRRRGVNIVFNRATNDMHKNDSGESLSDLLPMSVVKEAISGLPDITPDTDAWYPCMNVKPVDTRELMGKNITTFLSHAIRQAESLYHWAKTSIPVVVTAKGKVVNGIGRLQHSSEAGIPDVQVVTVPAKKAELARIMLNHLSMDFDLEDKYADILRYNSFRRASNRQEFLMPTMCCDLITATSKTGKTQRMASTFHPKDPKHVKAWKRWYGETVLDFGAGLLDKSLVMRDTMGVDCVAFEPYYTGGKDSGFDIDGARYITDVFLERVADGTEFDSIFLASVLNSVPFQTDREHVVRIVSALSGPDTVLYAGAISRSSDRYYAAMGMKDNVSNHETQFDSSFAAGYEEGVVVSDLMKHPKVQKYFSEDDWKALWLLGYSDVHTYFFRPNQLVQAVGRDPLPIDPVKLVEAIKFEFDLPFPDDTLNRVDQALDAFSRRLEMAL